MEDEYARLTKERQAAFWRDATDAAKQAWCAFHAMESTMKLATEAIVAVTQAARDVSAKMKETS